MIALNNRKCKGKWKYFSYNRCVDSNKVISQFSLLYDIISSDYKKEGEHGLNIRDCPDGSYQTLLYLTAGVIHTAQTEQWKEKN